MLDLDCTLVKTAGEIVEKSSYGIDCKCDPDLYQRAMDHFLDENGKQVCVSYTVETCTSDGPDCTSMLSEGNFYTTDYTVGTITEL